MNIFKNISLKLIYYFVDFSLFFKKKKKNDKVLVFLFLLSFFFFFFFLLLEYLNILYDITEEKKYSL